jgi:hypothetical protein
MRKKAQSKRIKRATAFALSCAIAILRLNMYKGNVTKPESEQRYNTRAGRYSFKNVYKYTCLGRKITCQIHDQISRRINNKTVNSPIVLKNATYQDTSMP